MSEHSKKEDGLITFDLNEEEPIQEEDLPDEYGEDDLDDELDGLNLNDDLNGAPAATAGAGFSITFDLDDDFLKEPQQAEPDKEVQDEGHIIQGQAPFNHLENDIGDMIPPKEDPSVDIIKKASQENVIEPQLNDI